MIASSTPDRSCLETMTTDDEVISEKLNMLPSDSYLTSSSSLSSPLVFHPFDQLPPAHSH